MKVTVNARDIQCAQRYRTQADPLYHAVSRLVREPVWVYPTRLVLKQARRWPGQDRFLSLALPPVARKFLAAFDAGRRVRPFTFELNEQPLGGLT